MKFWRGKRSLLAAIFVFAFAVGFYWLINWLLDPMRALEGFMRAIEVKDIDRVYAMVLNEEKEAGLSKEQVAKVLEEIFYRYGEVEGEIILTHRIADRWFYGDILWWKLEKGQRKPLPKTHPKKPTVLARVHLFRPPWRLKWQVNFSRFAFGLLFHNHVPIRKLVSENPKLREERWKIDKVAKEWARSQIKELWGIKEIFPLPVTAKVKGKMRMFWGKWQEEE
jgi:hypothetical protein